MTKPGKDDILLTADATSTEAEMIHGLLEAAEIPCLLHHRGRENLPEGIGLAAPAVADVYVPHGARERAIEVVRAAWDDFVPEPISE